MITDKPCYTVGELRALLESFPENAAIRVGGDGLGAPAFYQCYSKNGHDIDLAKGVFLEIDTVELRFTDGDYTGWGS